MKNVHVLPTDKPSRLWITKLGNLTRCHDIKPIKKALGNNVNIYITSNEEIKKGDWTLMFDDLGNLFFCDKPQQYLGIEKGHHLNKGLRKIILTTDQDLIKDGVQEIDDEFLEWFVKNPRCESVEVFHQDVYSMGKWDRRYKIIIPKEEPKQETLEEAAEKWYGDEEIVNDYDISGYLQSSFLTGAKWQSERMYSEEDIKAAWNDGSNQYSGIGDAETYFENLKKK